MTDHQPQSQHQETTANPFSASDPPSRDPHLAVPNPNQPSPASSDSSLSSDSSSDRFRKKTRSLPNLSDCHSCGVRINNTNPQERLQTLDSVWRIVLLCKKCIKRVKSAQLCSYCFAETAGSDCFRCRDCERRVHKDCVLKYRCSAPWSYCCIELGFSVCVDCWVPKLLANSIRDCKRKRSKVSAVGDSRVLVNDSRVLVNGAKALEDVLSNANFAAKKKVANAAMAKENALRKSVVAKRAVEFANGALDLVTGKDGNGVKNESMVSSISSSATTTTTPVVDDAALAFQLHRAMNSSRRISKTLCSLNSSCLVVPKERESDGNLTASVCTTIKLAENPDGTISEPSVCNRASDNGSRAELDYSKLGEMIDERTSKTSKECQENCDVGLVGNCSFGDDKGMNSESLPCEKQAELGHELHSSNSRTQYRFKCNANGIVMYARRRKKMPDRYLIKYTKRPVGSKVVSNRETKFPYTCFQVDTKPVSSGPPMNCSNESRTVSDASFQSCAIAVQASACGTDSSHDQS